MSFGNLIAKMRHFRGHGLHSPLVYGLKREAFMKKNAGSENNILIKALTSKGVAQKVARELRNVHNYCNFRGTEIVDSRNAVRSADPDVFYILKNGVTADELERLLGSNEKVSIAVLDRKLARKVTTGNIKIERSRYALIFKDAGLPVQTFKL